MKAAIVAITVFILISCKSDEPTPFKYRISSAHDRFQWVHFNFEYSNDTLVSISKTIASNLPPIPYIKLGYSEDTVFVTQYTDDRIMYKAQPIYFDGKIIQYKIEQRLNISGGGVKYEIMSFEYIDHTLVKIALSDESETLLNVDDKGNLVKIGDNLFEYNNRSNPFKDIIWMHPILYYSDEGSRFYFNSYYLTLFFSPNNLMRSTQGSKTTPTYQYLYQYNKNSLPIALTRRWLSGETILDEFKLFSFEYEQSN